MPVRITAVADVVKAMCRHRPYRVALGIDRAIAEIAEGAGNKYDADVAKVREALILEDFTWPSPASSRLLPMGRHSQGGMKEYFPLVKDFARSRHYR